MPGQYNVVAYESLVIAGTAVALTADSSHRVSFVGRLETAQVRYRGDGTAPTVSEGKLMEVGDIIVLSQSEIVRTQFIRTSDTSGVLKGEYYDAAPSELI